MDNPFRNWVQESKPFGKAACAAYTRALCAVDAIQPQSPDRLAAAERALRRLVADLNAINHKSGLSIRSIESKPGRPSMSWRSVCHLTQSQADLWFDDNRRF
jgi:hypothetical protein